GHNHDINAHVWMSVDLYRKQVENIANGLAEIDEKNRESYLANAGIYDGKLEALQVEQEALLTLTQGKETIMFHCAFDYVAEEYGLDVAFCMDLDEERQVSAGEVAEVLEVIEEHGVKYIFAEELYGASMCEMIQKEADIKVIYLDTLNRGEYDADSYIEGMRNNLKLIRDAFS
ncbi:MAG: zinc ABC transporter substrate-binding protein, partial [Agathobacter sp.]|nr:zinc ABC transporter substrate-binding protein [Agathobacter sp.]